MISITAFMPEDLDALQLQEAQLQEIIGQPIGMGRKLADAGPSFTARDAGGRILQCSGFIENHGRYASAWAFLASGKGASFVGLTRATKRVIEATAYVRIDLTVRTGFVAGHAWARRLGFTREGTLRRYSAEGQDFDIYALIREDR